MTLLTPAWTEILLGAIMGVICVFAAWGQVSSKHRTLRIICAILLFLVTPILATVAIQVNKQLAWLFAVGLVVAGWATALIIDVATLIEWGRYNKTNNK